MKTKICSKCNKEKLICDFSINNANIDGHDYKCKLCACEYVLKLDKTEKGVVRTIYRDQKKHSKDRGHKPPEYNLEELREWMFSQSNWELLYTNWVKSNYQKGLKPSVDRLNDSEGYSFGNIQLTTWIWNHNKAHNDRRNGKLRSGIPHRAIIQLSLKGDYVNEYISTHDAQRKTGICQGHMCEVCRGKRNHAGGFKWKYKN